MPTSSEANLSVDSSRTAPDSASNDSASNESPSNESASNDSASNESASNESASNSDAFSGDVSTDVADPADVEAGTADDETGRASNVVADLRQGLTRLKLRAAGDMAHGEEMEVGVVGIAAAAPLDNGESLARVLAAPPSFLDLITGRDSEDVVARHRLEYQEPSIWIWRRIVGASFAFIVVTLAWFLLKLPSGLISDEALPTQTQVATAFNDIRANGFAGESLIHHAGASLFRLAMGLGIGAMLGIGLGLLTGAAPLTRTIVDPISSFFRMVPGIALGPLILIWFGAGEKTTITIVAFSVMWTAMASVCDARTTLMRGSPVDLQLEIVAGMRSTLLLAWVTVLAVETVVASTGIGPLIWSAQGQADVIIVGIYLAGLVGFVLDTAVRAIEYNLNNRT